MGEDVRHDEDLQKPSEGKAAKGIGDSDHSSMAKSRGSRLLLEVKCEQLRLEMKPISAASSSGSVVAVRRSRSDPTLPRLPAPQPQGGVVCGLPTNQTWLDFCEGTEPYDFLRWTPGQSGKHQSTRT